MAFSGVLGSVFLQHACRKSMLAVSSLIYVVGVILGSWYQNNCSRIITSSGKL